MRIAVFASGGGTNLQSLIGHFNGGTDRGARVELVVSERAEAGALRRAADAGLPTTVIPVSGRPMADVGRDTLATLSEHAIDLVVLAGYLRLVPVEVIERFRDRILNIHPSLLPSFGGAGMYGRRVHDAVLAAGCRVTGATVHLVDERYDEGRIIAQWPVPVVASDTSESLAARVLRVEHALFPVAVESFAARMALAATVSTAAGPGRDGSHDVARMTGDASGTDLPDNDSRRPPGGASPVEDVFFTLKLAEPADAPTIAQLLNH